MLSHLALIFCLAVSSAIAEQEAADSIECIVCSDVATFLLLNPNASSDINYLLDKFCSILPVGPECTVVVSKLAQVVQELENALRLQEELDGRAVCTMINYCTIDCCVSDDPEQVHLSFMEDPHTTAGITWVTRSRLASLVRFGTDKDHLVNITSGSEKTYTKDAWLGWIHQVKLTGLVPGVRYYYQVGSDQQKTTGWSSIFSFVTEPSDSKNKMFRYVEIGDMGADPQAQNNIKILQQLVQGGQIDFIVHDGDISYADGYQHRWDTYFREVEPIVANIQYMTTPGNHEVGIIGLLNLSIGYIERMMLPGSHSISTDLANMYYSWNYGNTHFVAIDTENSLDVASMTQQQISWLEQDLSSVDRSVYPWVVVFGHRPLYCSNGGTQGLDDDCGASATFLRNSIELILNKYKVDIVLTAHKHNYERLWPVLPGGTPVKTYNNPGAPVYIVNGAGGNREGTDGAFHPNNLSAKFIPEWGYIIFTVYNGTTLDMDFYTSDNNVLADHITLVVNH